MGFVVVILKLGASGALVGILLSAFASFMGDRVGPGLSRFAEIVDRWGDRVLPMSLKPIEQILTFVAVTVMMLFIYRFPGWTPWAPVIGSVAPPGFSDGQMMVSAAGLLGLLLFAATQARAFHTDRGTTPTYLGIELTSHGFVRSHISLMMWNPAFQALVLGLFILPALRGFLPHSWHVPFFESLRAFDPWLLASAAWCASYAFVAAVLLLNVTGGLRESMIGLLQQHWVRFRIKQDLQSDSVSVVMGLVNSSKTDAQWEMREWGDRQLQKGSELPSGEGVTYLHCTIRSIELVRRLERELERQVKILKTLPASNERDKRALVPRQELVAAKAPRASVEEIRADPCDLRGPA